MQVTAAAWLRKQTPVVLACSLYLHLSVESCCWLFEHMQVSRKLHPIASGQQPDEIRLFVVRPAYLHFVMSHEHAASSTCTQLRRGAIGSQIHSDAAGVDDPGCISGHGRVLMGPLGRTGPVHGSGFRVQGSGFRVQGSG